MFEEKHWVVANERRGKQPFGIVGCGGHDHSKAGYIYKMREVTAGVMGCSGAADANTAAQDERHLQASAAHVLNFSSLIYQLTHGIEDEIDEHKVHNGPATRHGRAGAHSNKAALADRCVAHHIGRKDRP